jgi:hypothetical protein
VAHLLTHLTHGIPTRGPFHPAKYAIPRRVRLQRQLPSFHRYPYRAAGRVYATLRSSPRRRVTLDGQLFDPADPEARLYATFFCGNWGRNITLLFWPRRGEHGASCRAISTRRRWTIPTQARSRAT